MCPEAFHKRENIHSQGWTYANLGARACYGRTLKVGQVVKKRNLISQPSAFHLVDECLCSRGVQGNAAAQGSDEHGCILPFIPETTKTPPGRGGVPRKHREHAVKHGNGDDWLRFLQADTFAVQKKEKKQKNANG